MFSHNSAAKFIFREGKEGEGATPSGVSRLRRVSFEDIIYRKSFLQKRTDADGDLRLADSIGLHHRNGLSDETSYTTTGKWGTQKAVR